MLKTIVLVLSVCLCCLIFTSCPPGEDPYPLEGTWTITTTAATGDDLGSGTYTLTFWQEITAVEHTWLYYEGTGTIGGVNYDFYLSHDTTDPVDGYDLTIYLEGEEDLIGTEDWMDFEADYTESPITGSYDGHGIFAANTGTFSTSQQ